jgi:hypothetical protein
VKVIKRTLISYPFKKKNHFSVLINYKVISCKVLLNLFINRKG